MDNFNPQDKINRPNTPNMGNLPNIVKPPDVAPPGQTKTAAAKTKDSKLNFKTIFLYIILVFAGIIVARFAFGFLTQKFASAGKKELTATNKPLIRVNTAPAKIQAQGILTPAKKNEPLFAIKKTISEVSGSYVLNGIYFDADKGYALINNQIAEEGSTIGSASVEKITLDYVELKVNNKTIRLTTRGK